MKPPVSFPAAAWFLAFAPIAAAQSFEVASVKPASPDERRIECSGGPGTGSPGVWRCLNVPLSFVITHAYDFQAYQFPPNSNCCRERYDFETKLPEQTTTAQFRQMLQHLLAERFKLALHHDQKEMDVFDLSVAEKGLKMKEARPDAAPPEQDPWEITPFTTGKDGYPEFPAGRSGLQGMSGHYHWVAFGIAVPEMIKTLSFHLGRPVLDSTGLKGKYDFDLKWYVDIAWNLENSGHRDLIPELGDTGPAGPSLTRAVQDQLGLKLTSRKGTGDVVIIDHVEKMPVGN